MEKDKCVLCGKETPYTKETHIDYRSGYIEGAGQLCNDCYNNDSDRDLVTVPKSYFKKYSNNFDLGEKLRSYYYTNYR